MPLTRPKIPKEKDEKLLFDELTRLNNQLTLAKRELIKKEPRIEKSPQGKRNANRD